MKLTLRIAYEAPTGAKHDYDTQFAVGGLFASIGVPSDVEPFSSLDVELEVPGQPVVRFTARLTVATDESLCAEIDSDTRATLGRAIERMFEEPGVSNDGNTERTNVTLEDRSKPAVAALAALDPRASMPLDRKIATMSTSEKLQLAQHGDREARMLLGRDRAAPVQAALLRNPKTTLDEVLALARAPHLSPDAAESISEHRAYGASPQVCFALVRNPRTPMPIAMALLPRLQQADLRVVAKGLGVRSQIASAARKKLFG